MTHLIIFGYVAVAMAALIVWARTRPGTQFTKWQVLQVAVLLGFAFAAIRPELAATLFPRAAELIKTWVGS